MYNLNTVFHPRTLVAHKSLSRATRRFKWLSENDDVAVKDAFDNVVTEVAYRFAEMGMDESTRTHDADEMFAFVTLCLRRYQMYRHEHIKRMEAEDREAWEVVDQSDCTDGDLAKQYAEGKIERVR